MKSVAELYQSVQRGLELHRSDPLTFWRFAVPRLQQGFSGFTDPDPVTELHLRGPNKGTKSQTTAAYVVACCQKRTHLDGVLLPQWRGPIEAVQLVRDFPQQLLSVQAAYLKVLGSWPVHPRKDGETLKSLRIKPLGAGDDEAEWSVIHFLSQKNLGSGTGVRADIVAFDEPPVMEILRELRKAPHAGRRGIRIIAETPTKRREWWPLQDDYGESPRKAIRRVDRLRAEVRWSMDEVADWCISPQEKTDLWDSYRGDPLFGKDGGARWHGDYTSTEGSCPLDVVVLMQMLERCTPPEIMEARVPRETDDDRGSVTVDKPDVEVWVKPPAVRAAYIGIDPASGTKGGRHNPLGLLVMEEETGNLLARWNGYLEPYSVGILAAVLARQYHDARVDIEMKDHWGVNVVRGCHAAGYYNLCHEIREIEPGHRAKEIGWDANEESVRAGIGCVQEWLAAWRSGAPYAKCPSRAVIESLIATELDDRGKIVSAQEGGAHGEDMRIWGQGLRMVVRQVRREMPDLVQSELTPDAAWLKSIRERTEVVTGNGYGHRTTMERPDR